MAEAFCQRKIFTQQQINDALEEPLDAWRGSVPKWIPHLAYKLKRQGGPIIRTHINMHNQLQTEKLVQDYVRVLAMKIYVMPRWWSSITKRIT
jgi:hypothetical protein